MNPGICYLYEYEKSNRKRNIGFVKVSRHYQSCILQIHARGIPLGNGTRLELFAFYRDGEYLMASQIAALTCFNRTVSARLPVAEAHFPEGRSLQQIDGFLIKLPGRGNPLFWMASQFFFPVDPDKLRSPDETPEEPPEEDDDTAAALEGNPVPDEADTPEEDGFSGDTLPPEEDRFSGETPPSEEDGSAGETLPPEENGNAGESVIPEEDVIPGESSPSLEDSLSDETPSSPEDVIPGAPASPLENMMPDETHSLREGRISDGAVSPQENRVPDDDSAHPGASENRPAARKIQRSEIALLPRRYWFLANNSFLLHGYHNYNHLLLVEEDGHVWLGVPGVYHPREARAADLFGFPQFTRAYAPLIGLTEDECCDSEDFGHWCRYIDTSTPFRRQPRQQAAPDDSLK